MSRSLCQSTVAPAKDQVTIHATITDATPGPSATCSPTPAPTTTPRYHHNQGPRAKITLAI